MNLSCDRSGQEERDPAAFWSRSFVGALVSFVLLIVLGRFSEAVSLSFDPKAPALLIQALRLTSAVALFGGSLISARMAHGTVEQHPFVGGVVVWAMAAVILLLLAIGGIEIYGSSNMFGEVTDNGAFPLTDRSASWRSLIGILVSLLASAVGAWIGSAPVKAGRFKGGWWPRTLSKSWRLSSRGKNSGSFNAAR